MIDRRLLVLSGLFLALTGCSQSGPDVVPVTGKVTRGGKPVAKLFVNFQPDDGRPSWATSDENGDFELEYDATTKGARVGDHTVTFMRRPVSIDEEMKMQKGRVKLHPDMQQILDKYGPQGKEPLRITVKAGQDPLEIKLD